MAYPEQMVAPMRQELTNIGFTELTSSEETDQALAQKGTALVVINSVCGCAAGNARPGIKMALEHADPKPDFLYTAFAGNDVEAVASIRQHFLPYPPSSPCIAILKDGAVAHIIERHNIEGQTASLVAANIIKALAQITA